MKTNLRIRTLLREMAELRMQITAYKAIIDKYLEQKNCEVVKFYIEQIKLAERGLRWRATFIRQEHKRLEGGK